jgi:hypothetical protein
LANDRFGIVYNNTSRGVSDGARLPTSNISLPLQDGTCREIDIMMVIGQIRATLVPTLEQARVPGSTHGCGCSAPFEFAQFRQEYTGNCSN